MHGSGTLHCCDKSLTHFAARRYQHTAAAQTAGRYPGRPKVRLRSEEVYRLDRLRTQAEQRQCFSDRGVNETVASRAHLWRFVTNACRVDNLTF